VSDFFDVRYTAHLARLNLSEAEIATFQAQLSHVLTHVEQLKKVDIDGVAPTAHANPIYNVLRPDEPHSWFGPREALENAPRHANQLFIVPKVIE
jgi:aspartyl-tRNA(Asn)/glutamyl-tRNA(Gln) amidotransferase subunit C